MSLATFRQKNGVSDPQADDRVREVKAGYARGWSFTPLHGKKPSLTGWQAAPRETLEQAVEWARADNVGLRTGKASGVFVVDCDPGAPDLDLPPCPTVVTGRDGRHYYCAANGVTLGNSAGRLAPHVDTRGDGGQVVFPGSIHPDTGDVYFWAEGRSPDEVPMPPIPEWIVEKLKTTTPVRKRETDPGEYWLTAALQRAHEGNRNNTGLWLACQLRDAGIPQSDAAAVMRGYADHYGPDYTETEALASMEQAYARPAREPAKGRTNMGTSERPELRIGPDEHIVGPEAIAAIAEDTTLFKRARALVRVVRCKSPGPNDQILFTEGTPIIVPVTPSDVRTTLTARRRIMRYDKRSDEWLQTHAPHWLTTLLMEHGEWPGIHDIAGISDAPVLRPDGSIHQVPGHDPLTGVYFDPQGMEFPQIPDNVTVGNAADAAAELLEVVSDFQFAGEAHRSSWLAALLSPLGRFAFSGPAPLFLFDANVRGAGKGLLAQTVAYIVTGRAISTTGHAEPVEMAKRITSVALRAARMVLLDNVTGQFGNEAIDRALTSTVWSDRVLGTNQQPDLPLTAIWYATANNASIGADTVRRIIPIRLKVMVEHPEDREGFQHPDLLAWVAENRPLLLMGALTILAGYQRAGKPDMGLRPMGSFEGWSSLIRGAVVWCGLPDPLETTVELRATADVVGDGLNDFLDAWEQTFTDNRSVTAAELAQTCYPAMGPPVDTGTRNLRAALEALINLPAGKSPTPRMIGNHLRHFRQRVVQGRYLDVSPRYNRAGAAWILVHCECSESNESIRLSVE